VLKLTDEHYNEHGLSDLLSEQGPAYQLNIRIFNQLQHTITGWPGGKPNEDDTYRPERASPYPKRCWCSAPSRRTPWSPWVPRLSAWWSRATTSARGADQRQPARAGQRGDKFAEHPAGTGRRASRTRGLGPRPPMPARSLRLLEEKGEFGEDPPLMRQLKSLILRGELRDAAHACNLPNEHITFLDLPFYEQGRYRRFQEHAGRQRPRRPAARGAQTASDLHHRRRRRPEQCRRHLLPVLQPRCKPAPARNGPAHAACGCIAARRRPLEPHEIDMAMPLSPLQLERKARALSRYGALVIARTCRAGDEPRERPRLRRPRPCRVRGHRVLPALAAGTSEPFFTSCSVPSRDTVPSPSST
jgi:glucosamine-6-phosphate deaminase